MIFGNVWNIQVTINYSVVFLLNTIWFRNNYWWCHRPLVTDCRDAFVHNTPPRIALVCIFLDWPFKLFDMQSDFAQVYALSSIHQTNLNWLQHPTFFPSCILLLTFTTKTDAICMNLVYQKNKQNLNGYAILCSWIVKKCI